MPNLQQIFQLQKNGKVYLSSRLWWNRLVILLWCTRRLFWACLWSSSSACIFQERIQTSGDLWCYWHHSEMACNSPGLWNPTKDYNRIAMLRQMKATEAQSSESVHSSEWERKGSFTCWILLELQFWGQQGAEKKNGKMPRQRPQCRRYWLGDSNSGGGVSTFQANSLKFILFFLNCRVQYYHM